MCVKGLQRPPHPPPLHHVTTTPGPLQRLDLHSNRLRSLPPSLSALSRLDHLSLHR